MGYSGFRCAAPGMKSGGVFPSQSLCYVKPALEQELEEKQP